jgi:beta-glucosidase
MDFEPNFYQHWLHQASYWKRFRYFPCIPLGEDGRRATASEKHLTLSRRAATEGMVLLKNEAKALPFQSGEKIALFGKGQIDYVRGGGGSGEVTTAYTRNIYEGMLQKEKEGKLSLFHALSAFYEDEVHAQYQAGTIIGQTTEPQIPDSLFEAAVSYADRAVITICRFSGEGWDRKGIPGDGDFYLTKEEQAMVDRVCERFDRVVVVLDVGGMVDTSWFMHRKEIAGVLLAWQAGQEGGLAVADLLCGDENPSGKLTDTFAGSFDDYPSSANFNESEDYVDYTEDIYVGYRYFETIPGAAQKVNYPFGFGLSYTTFALSEPLVQIGKEKITVTVSVTNTGDCAGKEVVQVYTQAPQGKLGKPAKTLSAFAKTRRLKPQETQELTLSFAIDSLASFDDLGKICPQAEVLEAGEYVFWVGTSVRDVVRADETLLLDEDRVVMQHASCAAPTSLSKRMLADGSYEALPVSEPLPREFWTSFFDGAEPHRAFPVKDQDHKHPVFLADVLEGKLSLDDFIDQIPETALIELLCGQPNKGAANTFGVGNLEEYGIPSLMTADGPAGLRILPTYGVDATAWPCATLLACSWNVDLVREVGEAAALEVKENGISMWLAPAMNIHRSPLCGRNFEYYSEDPLIAGKMAAAMVSGIQSQGVSACIKHFCCNNKETNRRQSDSRVSERALREIYLKGFEICVKEADPWALMTCYNLVNGNYPSQNRALLQDVLRDEWGFSGIVTTDWWNLAFQDREVIAGNDLKMGCGEPEYLYDCLKEGKVSLEEIKTCVRRILTYILRFA